MAFGLCSDTAEAVRVLPTYPHMMHGTVFSAGGVGWLDAGQRYFARLTQSELCVHVCVWLLRVTQTPFCFESRQVRCWQLACTHTHTHARALAHTCEAGTADKGDGWVAATSSHSNGDAWLLSEVAFFRINVRWNGSVKLILSALVLRDKVTSGMFPAALYQFQNNQQSAHRVD